MRLKGRTVGVLVEDRYEDQEAWYPIFRMREEGATVKVIGTGRKEVYESKHGYPLRQDVSAKDVDARSLDAVIVPGGYAPDLLRMNEDVTRLVRQCSEAGKVVAAICHGGWVLASAGILRGRRATCYVAIKDDVTNAGARYVDEEVVVDGKLITSRKPDDLPAFSRAIIDALAY